MSAEAVEVGAPVMLQPAEAARLAQAVRRMVTAASDILGGGRRLDADGLEELKNATTVAAARVFSIEARPADVIDLAAERERRRRR
ncbi:hypothetical protein [Nonomuraea sp. NPDC002799]